MPAVPTFLENLVRTVTAITEPNGLTR